MTDDKAITPAITTIDNDPSNIASIPIFDSINAVTPRATPTIERATPVNINLNRLPMPTGPINEIIQDAPTMVAVSAISISDAIPTSFNDTFFNPSNNGLMAYDSITNVAAINTAVNNLNIPTGIMVCNAQDDTDIAIDSATIITGIFHACLGSAFFIPLSSLPTPNDIAPNIPAIKTAVINLNIPTGLTSCNDQDATAIAIDRPIIITGIFHACLGSASFNPFSSLPTPNDIAPNIPAIKTAVINLNIPTGLTSCNIQDDSIIAVAINTDTITIFFI